MDIDTVKTFRALVLFSFLVFVSITAFSQTCNTGPCTGACVFPATVEKGCNCFDGKDNDGNGAIDSADPTCASYYGLSFVGPGSNCSITPPTSAFGVNSFSSIGSSAQNTADTPAKISVGDMNGDGIPDAVVTQKFAGEVQVVATSASGSGGWKVGALMSHFKASGSKIFPKAGSGYDFEHETAIADIDKDKIGELYVIASYRPGGPNTAPTEFFLCGFTYANNNLNPLFDAVDLGAVRPGSIGIADFDGDGKAEVYLRNQIYAAESGVKLADGGGNWLTTINSGPVAVNMFGSNNLELVCGNLIYTVPSLTSRTLQTMTLSKDMNALALGPKYFPKGYNDLNQYGKDHVSTTSTADVDGDGFIDVVITGAINCSGNESPAVAGCNNMTTIFYWNVQKNTLSTFAPLDLTYPSNGWIWGTGRVNLDDATGDGKMDLIFVEGNQVFCLGLDASGNLVQQWVRKINDNPGVLALTVYDFNNDGKPEVVYRDALQTCVINGVDGKGDMVNGVYTDPLLSFTCNAYTFTEGPIVADVNGDGATDICITCYTSNAFNLAHDSPQEESLGQIQLYFSNTNSWIPTRKVWNEHPYYVTNINDNLTLPFPQLNQDLIFSAAACPNGKPGPQRPFNMFMDQVPFLSASGCPIFPAPNLTFFGDPPNPVCATSPLPAGCDTNGDGVYTPAVVITPPICGNLGIQAQFNLTNNGNLPITDNVPVSFFNGDPTANPTTAVRLYNTTLPIANLAVGATYTSPVYSFNGPGSAFTLYIAIYNDGANVTLTPKQPIVFTAVSAKDCNIADKLYSVAIAPTPFTVTVEKVSDNNNCPPYNPPNTGQLRAHVFIGATEVVDFSSYAFQWYTGASTASPIAGGTLYNLSNLDAGTYSVVVTNTLKGCSNPFVSGTIARVNGGFPTFTISKISSQTLCSPPNGELLVSADDGSTGYTYSWLDASLNPIGVSGPDAKNLVSQNYIVNITRGTCTFPGTRPQLFVPGPQVPDAKAQTLQNVVDCSNPNTGSVEADAYIGLTVQPPAGYTFDWYFYNNGTSTRGSILPNTYGTGSIRTGLPVGYYQAVITDNATKCVSAQFPVTQVQSQTVIPDPPVITQVTPQTSCDPNNPNGALIANATVGGVAQNPSGFTFQWFKGQNTLPANLVATVSGTNGQQVNKVVGGGIPYTVKITTPLNCTSSSFFTVQETINTPVLNLVQLAPNSVCDAAKATTPYNGSIIGTVTFAGSTVTLPDPNYTFAWYDGTTTTTAHTPATSGGPTLTGLKDGNYAATVTRTDLFCTSVPQTTPVLPGAVLPAFSSSSTGSNNCDPALTPDGTVTVNVTNKVGTDVFTYQWYKGSVVGVNPLTTGAGSQNGDQTTAIKVGGPTAGGTTYTVYALNKTTGCDGSTAQLVGDNSVNPVLKTLTAPNGICAPATNFGGSMTVSVTNIPAAYTIADYTFTWYDGATSATQHSPQPSPATSLTLPKLDVGSYSVIGKNTKTGCVSALANDHVGDIKIPPTLLPTSTGSNNCNAALTPDGTVSYTVTNPQPGDLFSQQWYIGGGDPIAGGLPKVATSPNNGTSVTAIQLGGPGPSKTYTVFVTNTVTGCTNFGPASVADLSVNPVLNTTTTSNNVCDTNLGFKGSMTAVVTNIPAGYTAADYSFTWYDGVTTGAPVHSPVSMASVLNFLDSKTFGVVGTNTKTGCFSAIATNTVGNAKINPSLAPSATGSNNCSAAITPDGTASVIASAGSGSYNYQWYVGNGDPIAGAFPKVATLPNNGQSTTAIQLGGPVPAQHYYTVLVTDINSGCTAFGTSTVQDISVKPVLGTLTAPNSVCDPAKGFLGSMKVTLTNAQALGTYPTDYTFKWYTGQTDVAPSVLIGSPVTTTTATDITLTKLDQGFYTVEATNTKTGCLSPIATDQVGDTKVNPTLGILTTGSNNCVVDGTVVNGSPVRSDGTAKVTASGTPGAPAGYAYQWYAGTVDPTTAPFPTPMATPSATAQTLLNAGGPSGATPTPYTVLVIDNITGCKAYTPAAVADNSVKPVLGTLTAPNSVCDPAKGLLGNMKVTLSNAQALGTYPTDYTFKWYTGQTDVAPSVLIVGPVTTTTGTDITLTKLDAGFYTVEATNNKTGCLSPIAPDQVGNTKVNPTLGIVTTGSNNCVVDGTVVNGVTVKSDGTATVTASGTPGAPAGYAYQWYTGSVDPTTAPFPVPMGTPSATSQTLVNAGGPTGATPSPYTVLVTDNITGCKAYTPASVADNSVKPILSTAPTANDVCDVTKPLAGKIKVTLFNAQTIGIFPDNYTFKWYTGQTDVAPSVLIGSPSTTTVPGSDITLTNLDVNFYTVEATNNQTGCVSPTATDQVGDLKVYPSIQFATTGSHNCDPAKTPDGTASATVTPILSGGVPDTFSFSWASVAPATGLTPLNNPTTATIINVGGPSNSPNSYKVTVTDNRTGCPSSNTAQVSDVSQKPTFTLTPFDNTICTNGLAIPFNGHVDITAIVDNTGTYAGPPVTHTYTWFDADPVTSAITGSHVPANTTTSLTSLDKGKYAAKVTIPELGCVSDPVVREVLDNTATPLITTSVINNLKCVAPYGGSVTVTAITEGGAGTALANYNYQWFDGGTVSGGPLAETTVAGPTQIQSHTYTVQATNKTTGCQGNAPSTIVDANVPPTIAVSVVQNNTVCDITLGLPGAPIAYNGQLKAIVSPAGPAYNITWTGTGTQLPAAPTGDHFVNLAAGAYSANATDPATGCISADDPQSIIDVLAYPVVTVVETDQTSCSATKNGKLVESGDGSNNNAQYIFNWSALPAGAVDDGAGTASVLPSGDYTIKITKLATGCATTRTDHVPDFVVNPVIDITPDPAGVTSCSSVNGKATVTFVSGAPTNYNIYYAFTSSTSGNAYPTTNAAILAVNDLPHNQINQTTPPPSPSYTGMEPGYLSAYIIDNTTGCESGNVTKQIIDNTSKSSISVALFAAPGACGGGKGGINPTVTSVPALDPLGNPWVYTYEWHTGTPTNPGPPAAPINFFNNQPTFSPVTGIYPDGRSLLGSLDGGVTGDATIGAGIYTLVVKTTFDGCGIYQTNNVPTASAPVINVIPTDITDCVADNGALEIWVTTATPSGKGYSFRVFQGNDSTTRVDANQVYFKPQNTHLLLSNLSVAPYLIKLIDEDFPTCPLAQNQSLQSLVLPPVVTVNSLSANTSCDPNASADGSVTITVTDDTNDSYTAVTGFQKDYKISSIAPATPAGLTFTPAIGNGRSGQSETISGMSPIQYTINVIDTKSNCTASKVINIPNQQDTPDLLDLTPTPESNCSNAIGQSDGAAVATIATELTSHFKFTWATDAALASPVYGTLAAPIAGDQAALGTAGTQGELLNLAHATAANWPMNLTPGIGNGDRAFYVQAVRFAYAPGVTGVGCATSVVQVIIPDQHISPDMTLTPAFNSFCSKAGLLNDLGDGTITIAADSDPSTPAQDNAAGGFVYAWTNANSATASPTPTGQSNNFPIPQLFTNTYQVTATNATNLCQVTKTVSIDPAPYVVTVNSNTVIDQRICNADGQIDLTKITIDESAANGGLHTSDVIETNATPLTSNYDFKWYKADPATPGTFNSAAGQELMDTPGPTAINNQSLIAGGGGGQYALMGAGTYYVVATRKSGAAVGANCPAPPYRVDVNDTHINPVANLSIFSDTSCDPAAPGEGEIKIVVTDATPAPFNGGTYTYDWTGGAVVPSGANPNPGTGNGDGIGGDNDDYPQLLNGSYKLTITNNTTGCAVVTTPTVPKNSVPVFVQDVVSLPQIQCVADGSIEVKTITVNDGAGASLAAPLPDFQFTWTRPSKPLVTLTNTNPLLDNAAYGTLAGTNIGGTDTYTVVAKRINNFPGHGCSSAPFSIDIINKQINPNVTVTPISNTSCDPLFFEGELRVNVTDATTAPAPVGGFTYNYLWTASATPAVLNPGVTTSTNNDGDGFGGSENDGLGIDNDGDHITALQENTVAHPLYTVQVTNPTTQCVTTASTSIIKNATPVFVQNVAVVDQYICAPDGSMTVSVVTLDDRTGSSLAFTPAQLLADFQFEWTRVGDLNAYIETTNAGVPIATAPVGPVLDKTTYTVAVGPPSTGFAQPFGAATYKVVTRRKNGSPGKNCASAPYTVVLQDKTVNPTVTLTPFSNTSCLTTAPEGEIKVKVVDGTDASVTRPGGVFQYDYDWTGSSQAVVPNTSSGNNGNELNDQAVTDRDYLTGLLDDASPYTLKVTNTTTQCVTNAQTTIIKNATPVFVQNVSVVDQLLCSPDGSMTVSTVTLNDRTGVTQTFSPGGALDLLADFQFEWTRAGDVNAYKEITNGGGVTPAGAVLNSTTYTVAVGPPSTGFAPVFGAATYSVVARRTTGSPGVNCVSAPYTVVLQDKSVNPTVTLTPFSNTSCLTTAPEGEIKVKVIDGTAAVPAGGFQYNYDWSGSSHAVVPNTSSGNNGNELNDQAGPDHDYLTGLLDDTNPYTLKVTNATTQCVTNAQTTIIKNATPVFVQNVSVVDQVLCSPDGSLTVSTVTLNDRAGTTTTFNGATLLSDYQFEWTRAGDVNAYNEITNGGGVTPAGAVLNSTTYTVAVGPPSTGFAPVFGAATYSVVARRTAGSPGVNCVSAPFTVVLQDKTIHPTVVLTPFANTSCNPAFFEGEITVKVSDLSPGATTFSYAWDNVGDPTSIPASAGNNGNASGTDGDSDNPKSLQDGTYNITVTSAVTSCSSPGSVTIFKNSTPVFTQLVASTAQILCSPDGKLSVNEVRIIDRNNATESNLNTPPDFLLSNFNFNYDRVIGGTTTTVLPFSVSTFLDNTNYVTPGSQPSPAGIGAGTYYVTAKRVAGLPGKDCSSAPYKVDILDKRVFPTVSLTPFANTSCDPTFFEGEIAVNVSDVSPAGVTTFSYAWDNIGDPTSIAPSAGNNGNGSGTDGDQDNPKNLKDGVYTISVTSAVTTCVSPSSTTIFKNSTPVFTQAVVPTDQVLCKADGKLVVTEVKVIDRSGTVKSNLNTPPDFPLSNFSFSYDRATVGNTVLGDASPFQPAVQLDNTNYPTIGFDTYYVVATRTTGGPGLNCSSAPYTVTIQDKRLFPKVLFSSTSNSSCNVALPNGSVTANASELSGATTDPYTFAWTLNGGALSPASTETDTSPSSLIANALDGNYIATATNTNTGCPIAASFDLLLDQTRSTPNIIDVATIDPIDCNPSASATVTKITLGSTFNSSTQPPNVAPNNAITGAALVGFTYTWYSGSPSNVIAGQTSPTVTGLVPGAYFVSVKDPNTDCQSGPKEADILDTSVIYPVVNITQTAKQISCVAVTGTAALSAAAIEQDGSTGTYNFTWYPSLDLTGTSISGPSATNPNAITNLFIGNYSVQVQNTVTSCKASALFIVPDEAPAFMPEISAVSIPLTYCVGLDGDAQVRVLPDPNYPNPPSYNYKADLYFGATPNLSNPPDIANVPSVPGPIPGAALNFEEPGLNLGFYTYRVTDNNTGCIATTTIEVKDNRTKPVVAIVQDNPLTNCDPAIANGQLSATGDGKIQGYTFNWYGGTSISNPGAPLQTDNKLIGETTGSYTVRVTNAITGCFDDGTGNITDGTVTPPVPNAIVVADRSSCISPDGEVSATAGGVVFSGLPGSGSSVTGSSSTNYLFSWYDGSATKSSPDFQGPDYLGRDVGPYTVTAKDEVTGCLSPPITVTVADKRVNPAFDLSSTPSYCVDTGKPRGNGSVMLTLTTPGMSLGDIVWTDMSTNALTGLGPQVFDLFPGTYSVEATSIYGCKGDGKVEVGTEISPYNGISANGDNQNDYFIIDCITNFPHNNVKIFNRNGIKVYEVDGYNNAAVSFKGLGEEGIYLASKELPVGTYFYIIDKRDGSKPKTGYLELIR